MAAAFHHHAIDRHLLAGPHAQAVADVHMRQFDILFLAILAQAPRRFRRQAQQGADGGGGLRARLQFQQLAQQGQRDDHCGGFEVHPDMAVVAERGREQLRRQHGHHAVAVGGAHAGADQRPHVGAAVADGLRPALKEGPGGPEHDRRAEGEFQPDAHGGRDDVEVHAAHGQQQRGRAERQRPPEAPAEIGQLRILFFLQRRQHRFQRHAAQRTRARAVLHDLRVHRAGVLRAGRRLRSGRLRGRLQIACGVGDELRAASGRTEVIGLARMSGVMRGGGGIDPHAADRIQDAPVVGLGRIAMAAAARVCRGGRRGPVAKGVGRVVHASPPSAPTIGH